MPVFLGLLIAVLAVSSASIFVRWCGDTPALIISFYRMFWSTGLFLLIGLGKRQPRLPGKANRFWMVAAGSLLALHFITWIASIQLTLISHSLILESTHPVLALLLSPFLLKEKGSWKAGAAAIFALAGVVMIAGGDFGQAGSRFTGDLLALAGALFFTFYVIIARSRRSKIDFLPYLTGVYASATILLFLIVIFSGTNLLNYPLQVHGFMLLLALVPTGIGHSLINWSARKLEAYKVNFSVLGEPVFASILAYFIFAEKPVGLFYTGGLLVLCAILLALWDQPSASAKLNQAEK